MKILALDVSGNWKEGKGTTGLCFMEDGKVTALGEISAKDYNSPEEYWGAHANFIMQQWPDQLIIEGYRLYNHKGKEAKMQANSELETPQLIGFLKMVAFRWNIPLTIQWASQIKTRWSDDILVRNGLVDLKGGKHYWNGQSTNLHMRDAMRHALHWYRYGQKDVN